eukprot:115668-Pyramimonas_sp.AAC.1
MSPLRARCGQANDTLFHRLWQCQCAEIRAIRDAVVPTWIQEEALDTSSEGYDRLLFLYGCFQHPGDVFPKPASSGGVEIKWHVAE